MKQWFITISVALIFGAISIMFGLKNMELNKVVDNQAESIQEVMHRKMIVFNQWEECKDQVDHLASSFYEKTEDNIDSISNYIIASYPSVPREVASLISEAISRYSYTYDVPVELMVAIMEQESSFNPQAIGSSGERGLMQIHPKWWKDFLGLDNKRDLHDIAFGTECGARILKQLLEETRGNLKLALKKYNGGNIYPSQIYERVGKFLTFREMKAYENSMVKPIEVQTTKPVVKNNRRSAVLDNADVHGATTDSRSYSVSYVVVAGDTYGSIAKHFYGSEHLWKLIADANPQYDEYHIPIGVTLVIPMLGGAQ